MNFTVVRRVDTDALNNAKRTLKDDGDVAIYMF